MTHPVTKRIQTSPKTLTIVYPPVRTTATGTAPGAAPVSPLLPDEAPTAVLTTDEAGYLSSVTMPCLWLDMASGTDISELPTHEQRKYLQLGWTEKATAMARVLVSDAALDPNNPYGGTRFDRADYVSFRGGKFFVLQLIPISASFKEPESYYVWLASNKQH